MNRKGIKMPYCIKCGTELKPDSRFCSMCGKMVETSEEEQDRPSLLKGENLKKLTIGCLKKREHVSHLSTDKINIELKDLFKIGYIPYVESTSWKGSRSTNLYNVPIFQEIIDPNIFKTTNYICPKCNKKFDIRVEKLEDALLNAKSEYLVREIVWAILFLIVVIIGIPMAISISHDSKVMPIICGGFTLLAFIAFIGEILTIVNPGIETNVKGYAIISLSVEHQISEFGHLNTMKYYPEDMKYSYLMK